MLYLDAFERCLDDDQGKLEQNHVRGTPNGLCCHMGIWLRFFLSDIWRFGRVGSKYDRFDIICNCR